MQAFELFCDPVLLFFGDAGCGAFNFCKIQISGLTKSDFKALQIFTALLLACGAAFDDANALCAWILWNEMMVRIVVK